LISGFCSDCCQLLKNINDNLNSSNSLGTCLTNIYNIKNDSFNLLLLILVYLITLFPAFHSTLLRICDVFSMFHELFCTISILSRDDRISRQYRLPLSESSAIWVEQLVRKSELCQVTWGPKDSVKWKGVGLKGRNPDIYRLISGLWFMS